MKGTILPLALLIGMSGQSMAAGDDGLGLLAQVPAGPVTLTVGTPVSGTLQAGDQQLTSGELDDEYTLTATAGAPLVIRLTSTEFDTYMIFIGPDGQQTDIDDTPGQGTNSTLETTPAAGGACRVLVTSYAPGMTGAYTLVAEAGATATAPAVPTLTAGQTVQGALAMGEAQHPSGALVDQYTFQGTRGQQIELRASATTLDPLVIVQGPGGFVQENNDVAPGDTTAVVSTVLPEDGAYAISVTSAGPGQVGEYSLTLTSGGSVAPTEAALTPGQVVEAALEATDLTRGSGQHFRAYTFQGEAGQVAEIALSATAFDTYLIVNMPNGDQESNDDIDYQAGNTNSRLNLTLPASGSYEVQVSSYAADATGPFRLQLVSLGDRVPVVIGETPLPPAEGMLTLGTAVQGSLADGDERLSSGELVDNYSFQGRAREGVTVELTSAQFDTYVLLRGPNEYNQDNDDGFDSGTNSRAEVTLPTDGVYQVMVTSYRPGETGAYELTVREGTSALTAGRGQIYAVLGGITDYVDQNDLEFCADDATKLHDSLAETGLLAPESTVLTNEQATRANLQAALARVAAVAGPDDVVIFFFSGHGGQEPSTTPEEPDARDETILAYDGEVTDNEMATWFDALHGRMAVLALDTCHSGGFARDIVSQPNRMGIFSSEEDVTSNTAARFEAGGYLSHFLQLGIAGEADLEPQDGVITVGELTQYLRRQWALNALDVSAETSEHATTYQNLVIDRGAVKVTDVLIYPRTVAATP